MRSAAYDFVRFDAVVTRVGNDGVSFGVYVRWSEPRYERMIAFCLPAPVVSRLTT